MKNPFTALKVWKINRKWRNARASSGNASPGERDRMFREARAKRTK